MIYYYPWDIDGVEIGNLGAIHVRYLIDNIVLKRNECISRYNYLLFISDMELLSIIKDNVMSIQTMQFVNLVNYDFIFVKYIYTCYCVNKSNNSLNDITYIKHMLNAIVNMLNSDINIYEYVKTDMSFELRQTGKYIVTTHIYEPQNVLHRTSQFTLFEQSIVDEKYHVIESSIQLVP
jgi:hypothetical protein